MAHRKLNKTNSSFSKDIVPNRANDVRRDNDVVKTPKITIEDVDFAILSYLRDEIRPQIIENGQTIDVPIMYANGEKWSQVQAKGYMRDRKGKIMTPVLSIRRGSITERDTLKSLGVNNNPAGNDFVFKKQYNQSNRYDRFNLLNNTKKVEEYYLAPVPEFVDISYEFLLWTEYTEQMNSLVQQIIPTNGFAYGTTFKFPTFLSDVAFETTNATGEDRVVRATIPAICKATLVMPFEMHQSNLQKRFSIKKVVFGNEQTGFDANISDRSDDPTGESLGNR